MKPEIRTVEIEGVITDESQLTVVIETELGQTARLNKSDVEITWGEDGADDIVSMPEWLAVEKGLV